MEENSKFKTVYFLADRAPWGIAQVTGNELKLAAQTLGITGLYVDEIGNVSGRDKNGLVIFNQKIFKRSVPNLDE